MERRAALDIALDMMQRPLLAKHAQRMPLPDDVLQLIRIAAESEEDIIWASRTRARPTKEVRGAAVMFLQHVLFYPGADSFRSLGLGPTASLDELHEHRRWLLKWLHPDRNRNTWESQLFQRVVQASKDVQARLADDQQPRLLPPPAQSQSSRRSRRRFPRPTPIRVRQPLSRSAWLARQIRRGSYVIIIAALIAIGWQVWNGHPIGQAVAELSSGRVTWLDW